MIGTHQRRVRNFQLTGSVLYDTLNAADANLGGFGRIVQKGA
ncbi:hypothetical protein P4133_34555 [Pseudomonas aeruginosa]|nr:hypothetical protein [Pseudomonas aeruginosa]